MGDEYGQHDEFWDPDVLAADKILEFMNQYEKIPFTQNWFVETPSYGEQQVPNNPE